jgi:hypothetical protein
MNLQHLVLTVLMLGLALLPLVVIARITDSGNSAAEEEYDYR